MPASHAVWWVGLFGRGEMAARSRAPGRDRTCDQQTGEAYRAFSSNCRSVAIIAKWISVQGDTVLAVIP